MRTKTDVRGNRCAEKTKRRNAERSALPVPPQGLEPWTRGLRVRCSSQISENANPRRAIGVSRLFPTIVFQRINNNVAHETRRNPKVVELCSSKSNTMPHTESTEKQVIAT